MNTSRWLYHLPSIATLLVLTTPVNADISLSQVPLSLVSGADPNVVVLFDNSGSMKLHTVGFDTADGFVTVATLQQDANTLSYNLGITGPCVEELNATRRMPDYSPLYYNPAKTYSPWPGPDKNGGTTPYAPANARSIIDYTGDTGNYTTTDLFNDPYYDSNPDPDLGYYYFRPTLQTPAADYTYTPNSNAALAYCAALFKRYYSNNVFAYMSDFPGSYRGNPNDYLINFSIVFERIESPWIHFYVPVSAAQNNGTAGQVRVIIKGASNPALYLKFPGQPETTGTAQQLQQLYSAAGYSRTITSLDDEIQNFANWFQYYRTRLLAMRAALAGALLDLPENIRIGVQFLDSWDSHSLSTSYSTNYTNDQYIAQNGPPLPLRSFSRTDRTRVFDVLFGRTYAGNESQYSTPLRGALNDIGQYLTLSDTNGPWSGVPGTADTTRQASCRRNYAIVTTDGYYGTNESLPTSINKDWDTTATWSPATILGVNSQSCSFNANDADACNSNRARFHDPSSAGANCTRTGTLSDISMYYWATDLRPTSAGNGATCNTGTTPDATRDMCNDLLTTSSDPAFWQHMVTHAIGFGTSGTFDPANPPMTPGPELWATSCPMITAGTNNTNPGAADDLYHTTINGHGRYINALSPAQIQDGMKAILSEILAASRSANPSRSFSATRTSDNPLLFLTNFDGTDWSGNIQAFDATEYLNGNTTTPVWSALAHMPRPGNRHIHTVTPPTDGVTSSRGSTMNSPVAFTDAGLNDTAKSLLQRCAPKTTGTTNLTSCNTDARANLLPAVTNANLINYLRGDATLETGTNALRSRVRASTDQAPLGDIVNSTPIYVGQSFFPYTSDPTYSTFSGKTALRSKMVYVGSNDGMLHAFRATDSSDGAADAGKELFAYVPWSVMANMGRLSRTDYTENHHFFVDGPIYVGDAKIGSPGDEWKSILVGVLGAGGQAVYALDVTGDIPDVSANWYQTATNVVKWEFTHPKLGNVFGQPTILKLKYGTGSSATTKWVAALGNGYNSDNDDSHLVLIDITTGELLDQDTTPGVSGSNGNPNGLAPLVPVDLNGDGVTDYIYAGDLKGNLMRFDVRDAHTITAERVFRTGRSDTDSFDDNDNGSGNNPRRPITGRPAVARLSDMTGTDAGVVVFFGTGRYFATGDQTDGWDQGFYAVLDRYSSSTTLVNGVRAMTSYRSRLNQDDLVKKSILGPYTVGDYTARVVDPSKDASGTVRTTDYIWGIGANASDRNPKSGWYMTLPDTGERSVSTPVFQRSLGRILFGTLVPAQSANSCDAAATGWFMVLNGATGGSPAQACGDSGANQDLACTINLDTNQGEFTDADTISINGQRYSAAGVKIQDPGVVADAGGVNADESRLTGNCVAGPDGCVSVEIKEKKLQGKQTSWRQLYE